LPCPSDRVDSIGGQVGGAPVLFVIMPWSSYIPFARTNYLFSSFVPSVVSLWNSLPDHVKVSPLSVIKAHVSHYHDCYSVAFCPFVTYIFHRKEKDIGPVTSTQER